MVESVDTADPTCQDEAIFGTSCRSTLCTNKEQPVALSICTSKVAAMHGHGGWSGASSVVCAMYMQSKHTADGIADLVFLHEGAIAPKSRTVLDRLKYAMAAATCRAPFS